MEDDKAEAVDEANPFSFKEFLKSKNLGLTKEDPANSGIYPKESSRLTELEDDSAASETTGHSLGYQEPFFQDPTESGSLLAEIEDDDLRGSYHPSAVEQTHASRVALSTSPFSTYASYFSHPNELSGIESLAPWTRNDDDSFLSTISQGNTNKAFAAPEEFSGEQHFQSLQMSYKALKEENYKLRRKIIEIQSFSDTQTEMVRTLERKLEAKIIKEETDYQDLESVIQQVEQNLKLMTKRAVKAENYVTKLKQDINFLQLQVINYKRENEMLRSGQLSNLTMVKQNTDVALQNLHTVMRNARMSIKQLVSGGETLNLVAEILKSIDKISEVKEETEDESL
ncbi:endosome-associated-trafficking regulator 1 isoform X2 [Ornithorhynchus anatinus]|uniref:endosome-associated-trafficking regulator 1 isoform X2 n=1 Tax=Ornithorhynchus anatinus TaxID=9258 RepID=UPI0010A7A1D4|nr:endosome-associated-trafficking regulator 1 isoform X2 [Ornithorhynchus anatinus]